MRSAHFFGIALAFFIGFLDNMPAKRRFNQVRPHRTFFEIIPKQHIVELFDELSFRNKIQIPALLGGSGVFTLRLCQLRKIFALLGAFQYRFRLFLRRLVQGIELLLHLLGIVFLEFQIRRLFEHLLCLVHILHAGQFHNNPIFTPRARKLHQRLSHAKRIYPSLYDGKRRLKRIISLLIGNLRCINRILEMNPPLKIESQVDT